MQVKRIRVILSSYDSGLVDKAMGLIVKEMNNLAVPISGPVPMPTKKEIFTVKRSPHVYKEINDQFMLCTHRRLLDVFPDSSVAVDKLSNISLPSCVDVVIKQ